MTFHLCSLICFQTRNITWKYYQGVQGRHLQQNITNKANRSTQILFACDTVSPSLWYLCHVSTNTGTHRLPGKRAVQYSESAEYGCISGVYLEYKNTSHQAISIFSGYLSESVFSESTEPERILFCSIFNLVPIIVLS